MITKRLFQFFLVIFVAVGFEQVGESLNAPELVGGQHFRFVIQTQVSNPIQLTLLSRWLAHNHFDVAGMNWHRGQVEVVTTQAGVQFLKQKGLNGSPVLTEEDTGPDPRYLNPQTLEEKLKGIAQAFPNLTLLKQIGTSLQGRPIWALLISTTPSLNDPRYFQKPSILIDGQHHAREIMTSEVVSDVADTLLKAAPTSKAVQGILERWNIWLVPMINVDGTNLVFTQDNMWRKNARGNQNSTFGVDINRNYPYKWASCHGSSSDLGAQDYHGAAASSEPETVAMVNLGNLIRPTASLSYHSYSEFVLYPYGCEGQYTGEKQMVENVAKELAARLPSDDGRGNYVAGTPWQLLYDVDGDSMDFFYAAYGALAYTFEINQSFQPPYSMREPTLQKERNAWGYFLSFIDQNLLHVTVVDGKTNQPAAALMAINTISHGSQELPFQTNGAGHFFKVLTAGHYVISAKLADGRVGQTEIQMNGQPQGATLTVP